MKSYHLGLLAIIAFIVLGCKSTPTIQTERIEDNETFNLCEGCPGTFEFSASIEFPNGGVKNDILNIIQRQILTNVLGQTSNSTDIRAAIKIYKDEAVKNYRDSNMESWKEFGSEEEWSPSFNWVEGLNSEFMPAYKNMQSYIIYSYGYTGGAHGIDGEKSIVFDLETGNLLNENDIFKSGWEVKMSELLTKHLKDSFEDNESYDMLFIKEIAPNGNFYITEKGITYIYGRYDIGPYVVGIVKVTVPWEELSDILK